MIRRHYSANSLVTSTPINDPAATVKYGECNQVTADSVYNKKVSAHPSKRLKLLAFRMIDSYVGLVIDDGKGFYHTLCLGGPQYWGPQKTFISFILYKFDEPIGEIADLNEDTLITFNLVQMIPDVDQLYRWYNDYSEVDNDFWPFYWKLEKLQQSNEL